MSKEVNKYFSEITFESDWRPSESEMIQVFKAVVKNHLAPSNGYIYREEERGTFDIAVTKDTMRWFWNNFPEDRYLALNKFISLYNYSRYDSFQFKNIHLPEEQKKEILNIVETCWDAIPEDTQSIDVLNMKISMLSIPVNRKISFTSKLMEANLSGNPSIADFWKRHGLDKSKDPSFYSMVWSKVGRKVGYTDERNGIINAASKCDSFPESIINDLASAGHVKNKYALCAILANNIYKIREKHAYNKSTSAEVDPELVKNQILIAKFASSDDYSILNLIIPVLRKQDLVFAAPAAARHGLQRQLDKYMNSMEQDSHNSRYR